MPSPTPSLRQLAQTLGLSVATVSEALRDSPRVTPATRARVRAAADAVGYQPNPVVGAAMAAVRRSATERYRGTIALLDVPELPGPEPTHFHREIMAGAERRAQEQGFKVELFWVGDGRNRTLPLPRLEHILQARGIEGLIVLPFTQPRDFSAMDFSALAAVQMDCCLLAPTLHRVLPDHYSSLHAALERLLARGYRKPGLFLESWKDARIRSRWSAAFSSYFQHHATCVAATTLYETEVGQESFLAWFRSERPDLIIGHKDDACRWLEAAGLRVPEDIGFFSLNVLDRSRPCAGLDLNPRLLGSAAVDAVVGQLSRHECGIPETPLNTAVEALWVEGPTLRACASDPAHPDKPKTGPGGAAPANVAA